MPDTWINRLVVSGPAAAVRRFQNSVARAEGGSTTSLAFIQLQACLPEDERAGLDEPAEPWNGPWPNNEGIGAPTEEALQEPGMLKLVYNFSLARYEPDELLIRASKQFRTLCFVLGWVAPNVDDQVSRFIHNGHTLVYRASDRLVERLRAKAYRRYGLSLGEVTEIDDPDALWADIEGDWACLEAVSSIGTGKYAGHSHTADNLPRCYPRSTDG
jgi:hypothetical protein